MAEKPELSKSALELKQGVLKIGIDITVVTDKSFNAKERPVAKKRKSKTAKALMMQWKNQMRWAL